ncbi:MAG: carboxypeptidase regulatory-like domain-containing protein [Acidobacteriota bacterium]
MRFSSSAVGLFLLLAIPSLLFADGTQTGVITGIVRDPDGIALPGVTVRLAGPQIQRRALSDADGRFRFLALTVGGYRVTADLLGLTAASEAVVYLDRTTALELVLDEGAEDVALPDAEEWIQVVGEAPVIDRFETSVGANVRFELLDELPVQRFYQSVAVLLPGVAGGDDGNPNTSGALRSSNLFLIDGVDTTDATTGLFGLNLNFETVQEVAVTTAAAPVAYGRASGAVINVVTRSGDNQFRGRARWLATNNAWNEDYDYPAPQVFHLASQLEAIASAPDRLDSILALHLGGPVVADRVWFFGGFENDSRSFQRPTLSGPTWDDDSRVESTAFKLTASLDERHTVVLQHAADDARIAAFQPFDREPLENRLAETPADLDNADVERIPGDIFALEEQAQDGSFSKLQWNAAFTQDLSLAVSLAEQERTLDRRPINSQGITADAPHAGIIFIPTEDPENPEQRFVLFNGVTQQGTSRRPRTQGNLRVDAFLQTGGLNHELEFGVDFQRTDSEIGLNFAGAPGVDRFSQREVAGQLFVDADFSPPCVLLGQCIPFNPFNGTFQPFAVFNFWRRPSRQTDEEAVAIYASDTLSNERWLVRAGLRFESVTGDNPAGERLVDDDVLAPRLSVSYDVGGRGEIILSASWGRYFEPFLQQYLDAYNRVEPFTGYTQYVRRSVPGRDCGSEDPADLASPCWRLEDALGFLPVLSAPPNENLERSRVDELVLGYEQQLTPLTGISLHLVDRSWGNLWDDVFFLVGPDQIGAEVRNLDLARREYRAVQLLFQKRFADRWQLWASYTWSEAEGNFFSDDGRDTFANFFDVTEFNLVNRFGPAPYDRPHQLNVFGHYQVPWERSVLSLGTVLRYRDGVPFQSEFQDELGVLFLTPRGSERLSGELQWDLAASFGWRLGESAVLELEAEVFNLTGERRQLGAESRINGGLQGLPRTLEDLQAPRSYRLSLGLSF